MLCECVEDLSMSRYRVALEEQVQCLRNNYVLGISALIGVVLATVVFGTGYIVQGSDLCIKGYLLSNSVVDALVMKAVEKS